MTDCPAGEDKLHCPHLMLPLYYLYPVHTVALIVFLISATKDWLPLCTRGMVKF